MKDRIERAAEAADNVLMIVIRYFAVALILGAVYVAYENFHIENDAFMSYELFQYKPKASDDEGGNDFTELLTLNEDTVAWLTLYDTHIDYPVVQGKDNFEYLNRNIYNEFSLSGSIYLDSEGSLEDWFTIIYGHHMDNGAMFGDLDLFTDEAFFISHTEGYLQTPKSSFKLDLRAVIATDAYDNIYSYKDSGKSREEMLRLIDEKAKYLRKTDSDQIIALSTCNSGSTFGRLVLVYGAEKTNEPIKQQGTAAPEEGLLSAVGHLTDSKHFALVNLVCMLTSVLIVFGTLFKRKKQARDYAVAVTAIVLSTGAVVLFFKTENISKKMVITDSYSLAMQAIVAASFISWLLLGGRRKDNKQQEEQEPDENAKPAEI